MYWVPRWVLVPIGTHWVPYSCHWSHLSPLQLSLIPPESYKTHESCFGSWGLHACTCMHTGACISGWPQNTLPAITHAILLQLPPFLHQYWYNITLLLHMPSQQCSSKVHVPQVLDINTILCWMYGHCMHYHASWPCQYHCPVNTPLKDICARQPSTSWLDYTIMDPNYDVHG